MFQKILLPVDLADRHQASLDLAAKLATPETATVTVLHVIETITELAPGEEKDFYSLLEVAARTFLERLGKQLEDRKVSWHAVILFGHRAPETLHYAAETAADLIILTAPLIDPANLANAGSLSFKLAFLSPCPVLMVK